jgi:membrane protein implicated in regulation of membrane protease activity
MDKGSAWLDLLKAAVAFAALIGIFLSTRRNIVGREGVVIESKDPYPMIKVNGGKWRAVTVDGAPLQPGEAVVVTGIRGLQLAVVARKSSPDAPAPAPPGHFYS